MPRVIDAFKQFFDGNGDPLVSGWLAFLVSGTTSTDKATYADVGETIANANPVQLDAEGRCPNIFGTGSYRVISYTNDPVGDTPDVQIQQFDPVGGLSGVGQFDDWNAESIYTQNFIVVGDDGLYYRSLVNDNQGNDPTSDTINWEKFEFVFFYNTNRSYSESDTVRLADGTVYVSLVDSNVGNNPPDNPIKWRSEDKKAWVSVTAIGTDTANTYVATDTTGGAFTRTLPASPVDLDFVEYKDIGGDNSTNNLTIGRNGNTIMGLAEDMTISTDNVTVRLTYFAATTDWRI